jgi:DNA mismatch repair protein MutL
MDLPPFHMERWQSRFEHRVDFNLSESGVEPLSLGELRELTGLDPDQVALGYVQTNVSDRLRERIAAIWGPEEAGELIEVEGGSEEVRVGGLAQRPDAARAGGHRRHLFVNGRPFREKELNRAVDEAYRTTVAPGVSPTFLLYLSVPPETVDMNVHPAKAEVRFRRREEVESALRATVRSRLADLESTPSVTRERGAGYGEEETGHGPTPGERTPDGGDGRREDPGRSARDDVLGVRGDAPATAAAGEGGDEDETQLAFFVSGAREAGDEPGEEGGTGLAGGVRRPELWQLHDSYILAATREGLLIIDQHAAHERVLFEEVMERFSGEQEGTSQRLLFPVTVRLDPAEYSAVQELEGLLRRTGFEVSPFGDRTAIIHASPNPHPYFDAERCFREMIEELTHGSPLVDSARNQHEKIAKSLACKGAIKAGQTLDQEEMSELFDRLFATELPGHDVHGRPTVIRLGLDELERRFGRT